jgi:catechol 2,3-dioxygenase-like lactoylglutathione lyase family enzyme
MQLSPKMSAKRCKSSYLQLNIISFKIADIIIILEILVNGNIYLGIHHCEILVTDLEAGLFFYTEKLGLKEVPNNSPFQDSKWLELGNQRLHLSYHPESDANDRRHFAIQVKNINDTRKFLAIRDITIKDAVAIPGLERFFVFDPFGNRIEFVQLIESSQS